MRHLKAFLSQRLQPAKAADAARCRSAFLHRILGDQRGTVAALAAVIFPVVIGGLGLGVETGYWYHTQRKLQHAADLAAHAASARNRADDSLADIRAAATTIAASSGYLPSLGGITVNVPPTSGAFAGDPDAAEVTLVENRVRWFTAVFAEDVVPIRARAVARIDGGATACILALSRTAPGAITVSGSTSVSLNNCDVASNSVSPSSFLMSGTQAAMTTGCVYAVGQAVTTPNLSLTTCASVHIDAPRARDPYESIAEPAVIGNCQNKNVGNPTNPTTVVPTDAHPSGMLSRRYCSGLDIKGQVTFSPGLYIVEGGDITFNGGDVNAQAMAHMMGDGVTFYLRPTTNLKLTGNVQLNLTPPKTGPYAGILFFGARTATSASHQISGNTGSTLQGAIYTPMSALTYQGNSKSAGGCTQIVADRVTMTGNSSLGSDCEQTGTKALLGNERIAIVE